MDCRFPAARRAAKLIAFPAALMLAACIPVPNKSANTMQPFEAAQGTPSEKLAIQSRAMQRTVLEGALLGAGLGAAGDRAFSQATPVGLIVGFQVGGVTGSYLGFLQHKYATNEERLERLRSDIEITNAETAATIRTMQVVLDQQRSQMAAISTQAGPGSPQMQEELTSARTDLANMQLAINGAEKRQTEFASTRSLQLVSNDLNSVDSEIAELSSRIAQMRQIASTMAAEI
jgi:hypothetical protein